MPASNPNTARKRSPPKSKKYRTTLMSKDDVSSHSVETLQQLISTKSPAIEGAEKGEGQDFEGKLEDLIDSDDSVFDELLDSEAVRLNTSSNTVTSLTPSTHQAQSVVPSAHSSSSSAQSIQTIAAFVRQRLPSPIPFSPGSPVGSISSSNRILTCFRLAEALQLLHANRDQSTLQIELYARVISSSRFADIQNIQFADLFFPNKPPYLFGGYKAHKICRLFEQDASTFLSSQKNIMNQGNQQFNDSKLCRAVIQLQAHQQMLIPPKTKDSISQSPLKATKDSNRNNARVEVLSIWETDWKDVSHVRCIVEPDWQGQDAQSRK